MQKTMLAIAAALVLLVGAGAAVLGARDAGLLAWLGLAPEAPASPWLVKADDSAIGGPFTLTDQTGARVDSATLIDGPTLLYFGYTFCPDVCPVDTQIMVEATMLLEQKGIEVTPVFVTVDPARDTAPALADFVGAMHPRMVGLTGTDEEIAAAARAYKVYYAKVEVEGSAADYLMNHSAFTYLVTPDGLAAIFRHATPPQEMAAETARILGGRG